MTEKQIKILNAALQLFAEEGYRSTSTSKVAKRAGVSEGLIFRHFGNKEGLLQAIIQEGEERAKLLFADVVMATDPQKVISNLLELINTNTAKKEDADFWKLQFKIKWELEMYGKHKLEPIENALTSAFEKLGYSSPRKEAELLTIIMDGVATRYFLEESFDPTPMLDFLKKKYGL